MGDDDHTRVEEWRTIPGHHNYEVSSIGRVRRRTSRTCGKAGQIMTPHVNPKTGHVMAQLWSHGISTTTAVSRLMAIVFISDPPSPIHEAAHNDGNPGNNCLGNIRWDTPTGNAKDRVLHGTHLFGETHPMAILSEADIPDIRRRYATGQETLEALGLEFGVVLGTIWRIVHRKTWKHVP